MLAFTPGTAAIGGITLGVAALGKYALTGRILGISGILRPLTQGDFSTWRLTFLSGLATASVAAAAVAPHAFQVLPPTFTVSGSTAYIHKIVITLA